MALASADVGLLLAVAVADVVAVSVVCASIYTAGDGSDVPERHGGRVRGRCCGIDSTMLCMSSAHLVLQELPGSGWTLAFSSALSPAARPSQDSVICDPECCIAPCSIFNCLRGKWDPSMLHWEATLWAAMYCELALK